MKLIITESKYTSAVKSYLDRVFTPDGGFDNTSDYFKERDKYGSIDFFIDGDGAYEYWHFDNEGDVLWVFGRVSEPLTQTFGENWIDIFRDWFIDNTRLNVDTVYYYMDGAKHVKNYI